MELEPEMKSTGEAIYFIDSLKDDFLERFMENEICIFRGND